MFLLFHNQLFPLENLTGHEGKTIFLFEDLERLRRYRFHKQKIAFELASMRSYADILWKKGFEVHYEKLMPEQKPKSLEERLEAFLQKKSIKSITVFEIEELALESQLTSFCKKKKIKLDIKASPMFLNPRKEFEKFLEETKAANARPLMRTFYQQTRKKLKILVNKKGEPVGNQFSFENVNPFRLSIEIRPKQPPTFPPSEPIKEAALLIQELFPTSHGSVLNFGWPTTREQALSWCEHFISQNFSRYADYEDSLSGHSDFIYHSGLSALLNIGLITPLEVLHQILEAGSKQDLPIPTIEAFVRQLLGWREYIRGIYRSFGDELPETNFWEHTRKLRPCWYDGTTGLPFLDEAIQKAIRLGYNHPVERLMILSNVMLLCGTSPHEAFKWFTEMHIDSAEWVTMPNVFGLGQYSDGGLVSTRPYICGSSYIRKMGHHPEGPWCDILDGLYWSFIERHVEVFATNPRIAVALPALRRLDPQRREKIFSEAENFRNRVTAPA